MAQDNNDLRKRVRFNIIYFLVAISVIMLIEWYVQASSTMVVPYNRFLKMLDDGQVTEVTIDDQQITGKLKNPGPAEKPYFVTQRVEKDLADLLEKHNVTFSRHYSSNLLQGLLGLLLPALVFFGLWYYLMRRMSSQGGMGSMMAVGKSKAKIYVESNIATTFDDVAGVDEAKAELQELVNFLKEPEEFGRLGAKMPKGVLLVGPPGTGKTLIARAVAGEARVPFFYISGSDFVEMFVGVGAARVRDLFEQARKKAPCIIFIDELDALGKARGISPVGGQDEKEQTLNQLLVELDGFDSSIGIVLLGATNRPEILDPALLRAGRFDRQVLLDRPDKLGRIAILKVHTRKIHLADGVDLGRIADLTPGFSGADLANLCNEAAIVATRRNAAAVELDDFIAAVERIVAGLEKKSRILSPFERKVVAHHEMGHALVASALPGTDPVQKVSIIPRGIGALGYTIQRPTEDRFLMSKAELLDRMTVLLGGRAAEKVIFNHLSTGAADDIQKATDIARAIVARYGMDENLGNVVYDREQEGMLGRGYTERNFSQDTARDIDSAVRDLVDAALVQAEAILRDNEAILRDSAAALLAHETLGEQQLAEYFERLRQVEDSGETVD